MWPMGSSRCSQNSKSKAFCSLIMRIGKLPSQRVETLFIGVLKEEKEKEKKEKDNQYKLKKAMAIANGLSNFCTFMISVASKKKTGIEERFSDFVKRDGKVNTRQVFNILQQQDKKQEKVIMTTVYNYKLVF